MIDRHGHLASDGADLVRRLLDVYGTAPKRPWTLVGTGERRNGDGTDRSEGM
jgi:hypothetical protein